MSKQEMNSVCVKPQSGVGYASAKRTYTLQTVV